MTLIRKNRVHFLYFVLLFTFFLSCDNDKKLSSLNIDNHNPLTHVKKGLWLPVLADSVKQSATVDPFDFANFAQKSLSIFIDSDSTELKIVSESGNLLPLSFKKHFNEKEDIIKYAPIFPEEMKGIEKISYDSSRNEVKLIGDGDTICYKYLLEKTIKNPLSLRSWHNQFDSTFWEVTTTDSLYHVLFSPYPAQSPNFEQNSLQKLQFQSLYKNVISIDDPNTTSDQLFKEYGSVKFILYKDLLFIRLANNVNIYTLYIVERISDDVIHLRNLFGKQEQVTWSRFEILSPSWEEVLNTFISKEKRLYSNTRPE